MEGECQDVIDDDTDNDNDIINGRSDDNEESLKKRFVTYEQATMPIIQHFEGQSLVTKLDATQ